MKQYIMLALTAIALCGLLGCQKRFQGSYKCVDPNEKMSFDFNPDGTVSMTVFGSNYYTYKGTYQDKGNVVITDIELRDADNQIHHDKMELVRQGDALILQMDQRTLRFERH